MIFEMMWEDEAERETVEQLKRDWLLYGEVHVTNAPKGHGLTRLDPRGITYRPPAAESDVDAAARPEEAIG